MRVLRCQTPFLVTVILSPSVQVTLLLSAFVHDTYTNHSTCISYNSSQAPTGFCLHKTIAIYCIATFSIGRQTN